MILLLKFSVIYSKIPETFTLSYMKEYLIPASSFAVFNSMRYLRSSASPFTPDSVEGGTGVYDNFS
jgi:hypothetical protein